MPNPKRRHSKGRTGQRRNSKKIRSFAFSKCANCGDSKLPHSVCGSCGYYKGVPVVVSVSKKEK